jgi:hypothetical protein
MSHWRPARFYFYIAKSVGLFHDFWISRLTLEGFSYPMYASRCVCVCVCVCVYNNTQPGQQQDGSLAQLLAGGLSFSPYGPLHRTTGVPLYHGSWLLPAGQIDLLISWVNPWGSRVGATRSMIIQTPKSYSITSTTTFWSGKASRGHG